MNFNKYFVSCHTSTGDSRFFSSVDTCVVMLLMNLRLFTMDFFPLGEIQHTSLLIPEEEPGIDQSNKCTKVKLGVPMSFYWGS